MFEEDKFKKASKLNNQISKLESSLIEKRTALIKIETIEDNNERISQLKDEIKFLEENLVLGIDDFNSIILSKASNINISALRANHIFYELSFPIFNMENGNFKKTDDKQFKFVPTMPYSKDLVAIHLKNFMINIRKDIIRKLEEENEKLEAYIDSAVEEN